MANSRAASALVNRLHSQKRQWADASGSYHNRLLDDDDFKVVHLCEVCKTRGLPILTPHSPQRGRTIWLTNISWSPQEDTEIGLDLSTALSDQMYCDTIITVDAPPTHGNKSKILVYLIFQMIDNWLIYEEAPSHCMVGQAL